MLDVKERPDSDVMPAEARRHMPGDSEAGPAAPPPAARRKPGPDLNSPASLMIHRKLMAFYRREIDRQSLNRSEQAEDARFFDHEQWSQAEKDALADTDQLALVYNIIQTTINWIIGTEKRGRMDYKVLARRKAETGSAQRKTQLLKYLADVNGTAFERSRAFEDAVKVGVGWLECGCTDGDDGEPIYSRYESWRNMLWDSSATKPDLSDARYIFRQKWTDLDVAISMFPDKRAEIERAGETRTSLVGIDQDGDDAMDSREMLDQFTGDDVIYGYERKRVRLIEGWFRTPRKVQKLKGGAFRGEIFNDQDYRHLIDKAIYGLIDRQDMVMQVAIFTSNDMLYLADSPYRHNLFPFTPVFAYRRDEDGMPYGVIRGLKMIQRDINKRASKALAILCSNKIIMDEGAVRDPEQLAEEVSRPNAVIVKRPGRELVINAERELYAEHLASMSQSIALIQSVSGVTDENLGRQTNASAGIAIKRRQDQGQLSTAGLFEGLRFACMKHGEKELSLQEQYFTDEKEFRITNQRGNPEYIKVNDGLPENDIARTKADFVISEQDWRATVRQAQAEELMGLLQQLAPTAPQLAIIVMDLLIESMDIPQGEEMVKRIRDFTGMRDPDAEEITPEEQAKMQAAAAAQERAIRGEEATIAKTEAEAVLKAAQAGVQTKQAKKITADTALQNVMAQLQALEAAVAMLAMRQVAPVADAVLDEAGYEGGGAGLAGAPMPAQPMQPQPQPMPGPAAQPAGPAPAMTGAM